MFFYVIYGLNICSEIPLNWLVEGGNGDDAKIVIGTVPRRLSKRINYTSWYDATASAVLIKEPEVGYFLVEPGVITIDLTEEKNSDAIESILIGSCMGALLNFRKQCVLHASSAKLPNGNAVAFIGDKKAGKSSLAGLISTTKNEILSDDVVALTKDKIENKWQVQPGIPRLKVSPEILSYMGHEPQQFDLLPLKNRIKHLYPLEELFCQNGAELTSIYVLEDSPTIEIKPTTKTEALSLVMSNLFRYEFLVNSQQRNNILKNVANLIREVNVYKLNRPKNLSKTNQILSVLGFL